jgi:predicted DNA binding CopG/RHH family protein
MNHNSIPKTDSIQELAKFWDSHDLTEFDDELIEITEPVFIKETVMEIHLPSNEANTVKKMASSQGISVADLIHRWVLEKTQIFEPSH